MEFIHALKHLTFMQLLSALTALIVLRIFTIFLPHSSGAKKTPDAGPEPKP